MNNIEEPDSPQSKPTLPLVEKPILPPLLFHEPIHSQIDAIQSFISAFQYNYTGIMYYKLKKTGGTLHVKEIYDLILLWSLPIQCVEAVFLACVITTNWNNVVRIPICFKSKFKSSVHRHIILAIRDEQGKWGALGISRRESLMFKPLIYDSLWNLILEFQNSYEQVYHKLLTSYCGLPIPKDFSEDYPIVWKAIKLKMESDQSSYNQMNLQKFLDKAIK